MGPHELIACICEGSAERAIIELLLENNCLYFKKEDLLEDEIIVNCRSAKKFERRYLRKGFETPITVIRILDSKGENFKLSRAYESKVKVINVVTAPEIEMLVIISEGKYDQYKRKKHNMKPSDYCKIELEIPDVKNYNFVKTYFKDVTKLIMAINKYKSVTKEHKGCLTLADLLKESF